MVGHQPPHSLTKKRGQTWLWSDTGAYVHNMLPFFLLLLIFFILQKLQSFLPSSWTCHSMKRFQNGKENTVWVGINHGWKGKVFQISCLTIQSQIGKNGYYTYLRICCFTNAFLHLPTCTVGIQLCFTYLPFSLWGTINQSYCSANEWVDSLALVRPWLM